MSPGKRILNSGFPIPQLGFGTWQSAPGEVGTAVYEALKAGYRHLDLALMYVPGFLSPGLAGSSSKFSPSGSITNLHAIISYRNQKEIANGIQKAYKDIPGLKREDLFITSKLWNSQHHPEDVAAALDICLEQIGTEYLDLYLVHWPVAFQRGDLLLPVASSSSSDRGDVLIDDSISMVDTWKAMTELPKQKVRSVGVANHNVHQLENIIKGSGVTPSVNQIERHPHLRSDDLIDYCAEHGIHVTAYSPLGNNVIGDPLVINHPVVKEVAESASKRLGQTVTGANVVIAWAQVGGHSVIPKSVKPSRILDNFKEIVLTEEEIQAVDAIGKDRKRYNIPFCYYKPRWDVNIFDEAVEKIATSRAF